ncbi:MULTISPECIES: hypothetical protein [Halobacteriales]|uniref:Uncharacterized protein n=2 Tax=Halobacteriales TaxID=2235 RepID=M0APJ0_9EURY|nr:hypothetical protein [Natrialba aegyptia]ELZ00247.1 hypothetical protein C480_19097 [Natrialba aegyptia DSM 13077]
MVSSSPSTFVLGIALGVVLVIVGIGAYVLSDFASITALIPTFFGVLVAILGVVGHQNPERQRLAAYGIGLLAVVGALGSTRGIPDVISLLTGEPVESTIATVSQGLMIGICLVLFVAMVQFVRETRTANS